MSGVAATFTNPVFPGYFADPFVLRHGDAYYAYGTGIGRTDAAAIQILRSHDLVSWQPVGHAMVPVDGLAPADHWAPEVAAHEGRFYLYFSAGVEDREHRIRVAVADRPEGPFWPAGILTPDEPFAIDPHPFRDDDGQWYLYYARDELDGDRVGTTIVVDRLVEMNRLAGNPVSVIRPSADWQLFRARRQMYGAVYDWHTVEGPFVVKRRGRYWCLYSGGAWHSATYGVSYGVADSPTGPFLEPSSGGPALLRSRPGELEGPGHSSVIQGPDGADYLVYHAWDADHTARRMCIDRLEWTDEGPQTSGPTSVSQPVPLQLTGDRS